MEVPSPSFTLVQIYDTKIGPVFHYDLWRLDGPDALAELDWEEALDAIVLVEWPDRLAAHLQPPDAHDDHAADGRCADPNPARRREATLADAMGGPDGSHLVPSAAKTRRKKSTGSAKRDGLA